MNLVKSKVAETWAVNVEKWPGETPERILQLTDEVLSVFAECFGEDVLHQREVMLENACGNEYAPITYPKRYHANQAQSVDYRVVLNNTVNRPYQFYYQAAHEFSHVFMECYPGAKHLKWISESMCDAASFFVLAKLMKLSPENKKSYFNSYLASATSQSLPMFQGQAVSEFYKENKDCFWTCPHGLRSKGFRVRNGVIALKMLELIEKYPRGWACITKMRDTPLFELNLEPSDKAIELYFNTWMLNCSSQSHDSENLGHVEEQLAFVYALLQALLVLEQDHT